jgi:hypothetical protein
MVLFKRQLRTVAGRHSLQSVCPNELAPIMSQIWTVGCQIILLFFAATTIPGQTNSAVGQPAYYWKDGSWKPYRNSTPTGLGQPTIGIGKPNTGIGQTTIGIGQNSTGIGQTTIGIGQNSTGIGQTTIGIGQNSTGIGQTTIGIGKPNTGIGQTTIGIGQNSTGIGQNSTGIGKPTIGIGRPTIGIGQQPNTSRAAGSALNARAGSNTNWHRTAVSPRYSQNSRTNSVPRAYAQRRD